MTSPTTPSDPPAKPTGQSGNGANTPRNKPRFRVQEAILILRQGKGHPLWREAAWHLIENAAKDTALLLEAQRDLLTQTQEPPWWQQHLGKLAGGALILLLAGLSIWIVILEILKQCGM